ncbi:MAG: 50S ribosomal protein L7/L12 [Deltaproteobacteria bacterium RBG_16_54_11]|nr:MAG: 50S ribosomal protein L7/L12 [Deltaproteobacteria bacterium RBG_16_54_11]
MTKEELIKYIEEMPVLELAELVKDLEDRFGVTAAPMAVASAAAPGAAAAPAEEEQAEFDVVLTGFGDKKIQVIKAVREVTNLGLKEAKDLVEGVPKAVKEKIAKEEAGKIKQKLEDAGGTAEIK